MSSTPEHLASNNPALYAAADGRLASLGADEVVFFHAETGRSQVMTRDVAHAFSLCRAFLPMAAHVERIQEALPALKGQGAAIQKVLEMLVANDLMHSDAQFIARFAAPEPSPQAPVSGLFLCAPEKPELLVLALDSLAEHSQRFPLGYPVYLIDLAGDAASQASHATALAAFSQQSGTAVRHFTPTDAEALVATLATALPEHADSLRWLLTPVAGSGGAARNFAALLAAGTRYLFIDADTALPLLRHPETAVGLYADARALAVRSFDSPASVRAAGLEPETDPLAAHLAACGASLAEAMTQQPDASLSRDSLHGVVTAMAPWLRPQHRIAFTALGRAGRWVPRDPTMVFTLDPKARAGLLSTRDTYLAGYRAPSLWVGPHRFGAGLGEQLLPLALDGGQLIPCTLPDAESSAQLQIELLRLAHPDSVDLDFPQALVQIDPGAGADDALGRPDIAQCLSGLAGVVARDLYASDPVRRLAVLAAKLDDLAGAAEPAVRNYLAEYLAWYRSSRIERMQHAMSASPSPPVYWVADLRSAVEAQGKTLIAGEIPRLAGWPETLDASACVARFRAHAQGLAKGLRAWPAAFELARSQSAAWRAARG